MSEATATVELELSQPVSYIRGDFYGQLQAEYDRMWSAKQKQKAPTAGDYFLRRQRDFMDNSAAPMDVRVLRFELRMLNMTTMERFAIELKDCKVPNDTRVPRGVYSLNFSETTGIASTVWKDDWYLNLNTSPIDLTRAERLSDEELYRLLEPPKQPEPEIVPVVFKRTQREPGDSASRCRCSSVAVTGILWLRTVGVG